MLSFFKKLFHHENDESQEITDHPQLGTKGIYHGTYCPQCGYMEVDLHTSSRILEGFANCPNCGSLLKNGDFKQTAEGQFTWIVPRITLPHQTGGHYRTRRPGPIRVCVKGTLR